MNCENIQNLISSYLDEELEPKANASVKSHLEVCVECAKVHEDFAAILKFSDETFAEDSAPPNSKALWCRINNIIETEVNDELIIEASEKKPQPGFVKRFFGSAWQFSPSQVLSSVVGIALVSSLLTIVGIKNFSGPNEIHSDAEMQPNIFESALSKIGFIETPQDKYKRRVEEQKSAIAYWEKRVAINKVQWDSHLQDSYDRSLKEIDKVVNEYTKILRENPRDKISTEMLDSALSEKMQFLRDFAEL